MDTLFLASLLALGAYLLKTRGERRRILLLATQLHPFQIEKLMEHLIQGYMRALGESDPARREQVWQVLATTEQQLAEQLGRLAAGVAQVNEAEARVCQWALPLVDRWWPQSTFDFRQALAIHAQGLRAVVANQAQRSAKDKAYTMLAELYLLQHTCHWFCKSKTVASARLLARHKTAYAQVLDAVSPDTRAAYLALTGQRRAA